MTTISLLSNIILWIHLTATLLLLSKTSLRIRVMSTLCLNKTNPGLSMLTTMKMSLRRFMPI